MKYWSILLNSLLIVSMAVGLSSCCAPVKQPAHPGNVVGWIPPDKRSDFTIAMLVLKKGGKSENGDIGVEVSNISPPERPCAYDSIASLPSALIRFYNPKDQQTICEKKVYIDSSGSLDCPPGFEVHSTYVYGINYADNWVYFELRGATKTKR
jgi:hypothetical protein